MITEQTKTPAERAVERIIDDLYGRQALGDVWDMIDLKTRESLVATWTAIISAEVANG